MLVQHLGLNDFAGTVSDEIGGGNGIQPMIVAAELQKVVLDADLMGRAYPNVRSPSSSNFAVVSLISLSELI